MICSVVLLLLLWQTEEKCTKLQASLAEAEEKLSSKFPDSGASVQSGTAAGSAGASQVHVASSLSSSSSSSSSSLLLV